MWFKVLAAGVLAGLAVYERKREKPRLTAKYLAWETETTEFPLIGTESVKEKLAWCSGDR